MSKSTYTGYTPARRDANKRYDGKTYKTYTFLLRIEDDADIIKSLETAREHGNNKREWLREVFEGSGYTKEDIINAFDGFRGVLDERIISNMLCEIDDKKHL